jgi:hypothetical protein
MKQQKNARTLSEITDAVHSLERTNIIDIGDLLLEAKEQGCEFGEWMDWLETEFEWSVTTAERFMNVARLVGKFPKLGNLKLGKTALYALADHGRKGDLPAIIEELAKHATETRLPWRDAKRVIKTGIGRSRFGDHPDATLVRLVELDEYSGEPWHRKAVAALREREPKTGESASAIIDEFVEAERKAHMAALDAEYAALLRSHEGEAKARDEAKDEAESLLDGAPPDLPPPTTPPEPQKLHADTDWAETKSFVDAVKELLELQAKPVARFVGMFTPDTLRDVSDFLMAVAAVESTSTAQQHADQAKAEALN